MSNNYMSNNYMSNNWLLEEGYVNQRLYFYHAGQYYVLWCILYVYIKCLLKKYPVLNYLPPDKRYSGMSRIFSSLHAIILSTWSISYLINIIDYQLWTRCLPISAAFGTFDLYIVTSKYKHFKKDYITICSHHLVLIGGPLLINEENSKICSQTYLFELTVPVLDISWYLYNSGLNNTLFFKFNSVITVLFFTVFRIINNIYLLCAILYQRRYILLLVAIYFLYINVTWFKALLNVFLNG